MEEIQYIARVGSNEKKEHSICNKLHCFLGEKKLTTTYYVLLRQDREIFSLVVADRDDRQKVQVIDSAGVVHIRVPLFL
jgi:hypothetical protein